MKAVLTIGLIFDAFSCPVIAAPVLAPLFADHSVLQRDAPLPVFGTAAPDEKLIVTLGMASVTTRADATGAWRVSLPQQPADDQSVDLVVIGAGGTRVVVHDIVIGDVWLCSGQSNMELQVSRALNSYNEMSAANGPLLRFVTIPRAELSQPTLTTERQLRWLSVSRETLGDFSAVCYYMAKDLRATRHVPIGAIAASWGGTKIVPWIPQGPIYNGMIAPLGAYGVKGVAWYQGESDVGNAGYHERLTNLMASWRAQFKRHDLPFLIVGLSNYGSYSTIPGESDWATLREEQRQAVAADTDAAVVPTFDIGERTDIHPANKQLVGQRLAAAAVALAYGEPAMALPKVREARRAADGSFVVTFEHVQGALHSWSGNAVLGFELCDSVSTSCRFAAARAQDKTVLLSDDHKPVTKIRYAWADSPIVNLYDERAFPPGPFEISVAHP